MCGREMGCVGLVLKNGKLYIMQIIPPVDLPEHLEYNYDPELLDFIKLNLPGIRYINLQKFLGRDKYDPPCFKIEIQDKPVANQVPERLDPRELTEIIFKLFQLKAEADDAGGKFRVQVYRKTNQSENTQKSKHVDISPPGSGNQKASIIVPSDVESDVLGSQGNYIMMMHEHSLKMLSVLINVIEPLQRQNLSLQNTVQENYKAMVEIERMRHTRDIVMEEKKDEMKLNELKILKSAATKQQLISTLEKTGAIKAFSDTLSKKFAGIGGNGQEQQNVQPPPQYQAPPPQYNPRSQPPRQEYKEVSPQEPVMTEPVIEKIDPDLKTSPLHAYCDGLKSSLEIDTLEKKEGEETLLEFIKMILRPDMYEKLIILLNSESEKDAISNLITLRQTFKPDDMNDLEIVYEKLSDLQKKLIGEIMSFKLTP